MALPFGSFTFSQSSPKNQLLGQCLLSWIMSSLVAISKKRLRQMQRNSDEITLKTKKTTAKRNNAGKRLDFPVDFVYNRGNKIGFQIKRTKRLKTRASNAFCGLRHNTHLIGCHVSLHRRYGHKNDRVAPVFCLFYNNYEFFLTF